ncbi:hypothetical protein COCNU_06G018950 [Cocos nucifera]|uniref:Uncharacterized protein n=1 Tax=Cocos nucifera TaxID=13894 RepID=A0A8K0N3V9_COCNU|nr:hypothetical protein COCNU_06G018950 [Cocos nucifera]
MHNSASKEQSKHTPSTSALTAQEPPSSTSTLPMASTPSVSEPPPSPTSPTYATPLASEYISWFHMYGTRVKPSASSDSLLRCEGERRYDFFDHERAQDA